MKNISLFWKKLGDPIFQAIAMCVAGLAFIILPDKVLDTVILVLGALVCAVAVGLIAAWSLDAAQYPVFMRHAAILKSSVMMIFGISLMLVRSSVSRPVCIILGVLLSLYSLFRLTRPERNVIVERTAGWYFEWAILVFFIFLGALIAIIPLWPKITAGIAMLAFGSKLLSDSLVRRARARRANPPAKRAKGKKEKRDIYDAHFIDKSDN